MKKKVVVVVCRVWLQATLLSGMPCHRRCCHVGAEYEVCGRMWGDVASSDAESGGGGKRRDVATSHRDGGVCGVGCKWGGMALLPRRHIEISGPNKNFSVL